MKKKEIITLIIALVAMVVSIFLGYSMLFPAKKTQTTESVKATEIPTISGEIDEKTYKSVESLSDYGQPALEGIGKTDLFAN